MGRELGGMPIEGCTASEVEFVSEDEEVKIIPKFQMAAVNMIEHGSIGPFRAQIPISVPLWLALSLRKSGFCLIKPPYWLDLAWLRAKLEEGREDDLFFTSLPFHYMEIASQLLSIASEDVPEASTIRSVLLDLEAVRHAKLRKGFMSIDGSQMAIQFKNVSAMEINRVRPFFSTCVDQLRDVTEMEKSLPDVDAT